MRRLEAAGRVRVRVRLSIYLSVCLSVCERCHGERVASRSPTVPTPPDPRTEIPPRTQIRKVTPLRVNLLL